MDRLRRGHDIDDFSNAVIEVVSEFPIVTATVSFIHMHQNPRRLVTIFVQLRSGRIHNVASRLMIDRDVSQRIQDVHLSFVLILSLPTREQHG